MSLAREIFEKMVRTGQVKGEPEPLPLETPGQPSQVPVVDPVRGDQPEPETPGPLFGGSIEEDQLESQKISTGGGAKKDKISPVKIYSRLFGEEIWLVADQEEMETLVSKGVKEVVYMAGEIPLLKEMNKEKLITIHSVKKIFQGAGLA